MKNLTKKTVKAAYRSIPRFLWKLDELNQLSDEAKLLYLFLLTHPDLTEVGTLWASKVELASELGWSLAKWQTTLKDPWVQQEVYCDEKAPLFWLPRVLKHRPPQSPAHARLWWHALSRVPLCPLQQTLCAEIKRLLGKMPKNLHWYLSMRLRSFEARNPTTPSPTAGG